MPRRAHYNSLVYFEVKFIAFFIKHQLSGKLFQILLMTGDLIHIL